MTDNAIAFEDFLQVVDFLDERLSTTPPPSQSVAEPVLQVPAASNQAVPTSSTANAPVQEINSAEAPVAAPLMDLSTCFILSAPVTADAPVQEGNGAEALVAAPLIDHSTSLIQAAPVTTDHPVVQPVAVARAYTKDTHILENHELQTLFAKQIATGKLPKLNSTLQM